MSRDEALSSEAGATLVLALVFVIAIALILVAIITLTGTNLVNTANLENERAVEYSADGAVDAAVQVVRYQSPVTACSPTTGFSTGSVNGDNLLVYCEVANPNAQRQVTFTACPSSDQSLATCPISDQILVAQVVYTDPGCTSGSGSGCTAGQTATVVSWVVERSNS